MLLLSIGVLLFFRIPHRTDRAPRSAVVAPANGRVTMISTETQPDLGSASFQRVVTFLSVFNVHVQRSPVAGEVVDSRYRRGRKVAAFRADADEVNEQNFTVFKTETGDLIGMCQIAGLVARRVVSYLKCGDRVERTQLIGLIKFGSRVDLYVPLDYRLNVEIGDRMVEGETVIATPNEARRE